MSQNTPAELKLRPSDAHRWLVCKASPGYILQNHHCIPVETFEHTEEGTRAHEAAKQLLIGRKPAYDAGDMKLHVEGYRDFILKAKSKGDVTLIVESAVKVFYYAGKKGYVDAALIYVGKDGKVHRIHTFDLKYGRGVSVQAEGNPQLATYTFGLIKDLEDIYNFHAGTEVLMTIWQPRVKGEPAERTWAIDTEELSAFCHSVSEVAEEIRADPFNQPFTPSDDACQFCPAYTICGARTRWLLGGLEYVTELELVPQLLEESPTLEPSGIDLPAPQTLTPDQLSRILQMKPMLVKWLTKVEDFIVASALQHDVCYTGFKVVETSPHRKWADEERAARFLREHLGAEVASPRKLISPSKALELMAARKKAVRQDTLSKIHSMITKPRGQPTLAPESDPRPAWQEVSAADEFSDESMSEDDKSLL